MCSLRFENNFLIIEGVRFASISKKKPLSKLSFAFVSLALPFLLPTIIFPWFIFFLFLKRSVQYITIFNFSIPLLFCVFSYLWKEIFHECLWKSCVNFAYVFFAPYKVNIPMYSGEFFLCYFFVPYKVNIPMYAGGFKQVQYKEYICWMQVKIYISDQTSLRICNSVPTLEKAHALCCPLI